MAVRAGTLVSASLVRPIKAQVFPRIVNQSTWQQSVMHCLLLRHVIADRRGPRAGLKLPAAQNAADLSAGHGHLKIQKIKNKKLYSRIQIRFHQRLPHPHPSQKCNTGVQKEWPRQRSYRSKWNREAKMEKGRQGENRGGRPTTKSAQKTPVSTTVIHEAPTRLNKTHQSPRPTHLAAQMVLRAPNVKKCAISARLKMGTEIVLIPHQPRSPVHEYPEQPAGAGQPRREPRVYLPGSRKGPNELFDFDWICNRGPAENSPADDCFVVTFLR